MEAKRDFTIGYDVGFVGRWFRLIVGLYFSVLATVVPLIQEPVSAAEALSFLGTLGLYLLLILGVYVAAFYILAERVLARANPWVGTLILLGPLVLITAFQWGPQAFRVALGAYYSIASIFNFAMSYGGCEVVAIPSLIFRRRYTLYCPYNAVDAVESALMVSSGGQKILAVISMTIAVSVGGYFLLIEEFNMIRDLGLRIDIPNQWALLLLIPIAHMGWNTWRAYRTSGRQFTRPAQRLVLGTLILLVLTIMFVIGADAQPLFALAMLIGGGVAFLEWLRGRGERASQAGRAA